MRKFCISYSYSYFPVGQAYITLALAIYTLIERVVLYTPCSKWYNIIIDFLGQTIFGRPGPILAAKAGPAGQNLVDQNWSGWATFGPEPKFLLQHYACIPRRQR